MPDLEHVAFHLEAVTLLHRFAVWYCGPVQAAPSHNILAAGISRAVGVLQAAILAVEVRMFVHVHAAHAEHCAEAAATTVAALVPSVACGTCYMQRMCRVACDTCAEAVAAHVVSLWHMCRVAYNTYAEAVAVQ